MLSRSRLVQTLRHAPRLSRSRAPGRSVASYSTQPVRDRESSQCTPIEKIISDTIRATGPISYATYMQMCLSHPTEGYYMNPAHPVFGARGDFITSPEISQVFGELVAIWLITQWQHFGGKKSIRLVELGPGRGTLMADVLRVFNHFARTGVEVSEVHLVETSPSMKALQAETIKPSAESQGHIVAWKDSLDDVPEDKSKFTMVLAHEFFDALPFHLIQKSNDGWREVLIAHGPDPTAKTTLTASKNSTAVPGDLSSIIEKPIAPFHPVLAPGPLPSSTLLGNSSPRFATLPINTRVEASPAAYKTARRIAELLSSEGAALENDVAGCGLIVDYGGDKCFGTSFRAFKDHKIVDVFYRPGECDLTTNVDFAYLKEAMGDLVEIHGPIPQSTFLDRMGVGMRVDALKRAAKDESRRASIQSAAQRLLDGSGMGGQYQFMGVTGKPRLPLAPKDEQKWPFVKV